MIFFKACWRCGGAVEATFYDDVYCVQCGCRFYVDEDARAARRPSSQTHRLELVGSRFIARARREV